VVMVRHPSHLRQEGPVEGRAQVLCLSSSAGLPEEILDLPPLEQKCSKNCQFGVILGNIFNFYPFFGCFLTQIEAFLPQFCIPTNFRYTDHAGTRVHHHQQDQYNLSHFRRKDKKLSQCILRNSGT